MRDNVIGPNCLKMSSRAPPIIYLNRLIMGGCEEEETEWQRQDEEEEGEKEEERRAASHGENALLCAAVASLFSVLTDARAQPLDEWPPR